MSVKLHMNSGGVAKDNDLSTNETNHIHLYPASNQIKIDNWMGRIGSLLQVGADYAALQSVLELIAIVFEPDRLFVINHPEITELEVPSVMEILVVLKDSQIKSKKVANALFDLASLDRNNVLINFELASAVELGIKKGHCHYELFCTEDNLVFSNNPYRLRTVLCDKLIEKKAEISERFEEVFRQANDFLIEAERLIANNSLNLAALILHRCVEYVYKHVLFFYDNKFYTTHRLSKLEIKVNVFFPQACSQVSKAVIWILDEARKNAAAPFFNMEEIWDEKPVLEEVKRMLEVMKGTIERRMLII